jgi:hypothetical protein
MAVNPIAKWEEELCEPFLGRQRFYDYERAIPANSRQCSSKSIRLVSLDIEVQDTDHAVLRNNFVDRDNLCGDCVAAIRTGALIDRYVTEFAERSPIRVARHQTAGATFFPEGSIDEPNITQIIE